VTAPPDLTEADYHEPEPPVPRRGIGLSVAKFFAVLALIGVVAWVGMAIAPRLAESVAGDPEESTVALGEEVAIQIPAGASARSIANLLEESGIIADAGDFESTIRAEGVADQLKAGAYTLIGGVSTEALIQELTTGPPAPDTIRITVIEGLRIEEMLLSIAAQTGHTVPDLEAVLLDGTVTSPLLPDDLPEGAPPLTAWEGLLFPATYDFVADAPPQRILRRMAEELATRVEAVDWAGLRATGLTPYEGLVIASLIEKEAKLEEDRPIISSVIANRLEEGMPLQIDATVIYAMGENPGRVLERDLEIDSPWNTYRNGGLPPTPIGGVRATSLEAAAAPEDTDYFYYVLVDEDGSHGFSETLEEHNAKVAQARADGVLQ
jgi:UPF0755 protein